MHLRASVLLRIAWRRCGTPSLLLLALGTASSLLAEATPPFRIGFSASMFSRINENDARASIAALAATVAREKNINVAPDTHIYTSLSAIKSAFHHRAVDAVGLTLPEFWVLRRDIRFGRYMVALYDGSPAESYLLLTRRDGGPADAAALRGKRLSWNTTSRHSLALTWLDLELHAHGLPGTSTLFGSVAETTRPSKAVLDVYFGQSDACVIAERILRTVVELNPQLGRSLRVLARSPPLVPMVLVLDAQTEPTLQALAVEQIGVLDQTPAGRQVLTMMRLGAVAETSFDRLADSLALLDEHARFCPEAAAARTSALEHQRLPSANIE